MVSVQAGKQPSQPSRSLGSDESATSSAQAPQEKSFQIAAPSISLPKGGGAIRGMGEKFAANPVTGTGSMTLPITTSPGRSGFGPQLSLSYDSGAGNGPFGFSWSLSLPSITRKTEKGLPKYQDALDSDVFILSGAEDLVPLLIERNGKWERETLDPRTVGGQTYQIQRYRPRIEGLFARIERWTNTTRVTDVFWRSISKDNITTWYGKTDESRISDPNDKSHIFSWLICQSYDDKGNVIVYHYKPENSDNVDLVQVHEKNRTDNNQAIGDEYKANRTANRYIKRVCYGNREPYLPVLTESKWPQPPDQNPVGGSPNYYFSVVFDYEDGHYRETAPDVEGRILAQVVYDPPASAKWARRVDPFSTYRAGFEVRTYRLCQRVLMFHHFPDELGTPDCLVRSTDFTYSYEDHPNNARNPIYSFLDSVSQAGYLRQGATYLKKSLPPVEFEYTQPTVQDSIEEVDQESLENLPIGLDSSVYRWTDLHGEGIPGILSEQGGAWFYKRNWSPVPDKLLDGSEVVKAKFSALETVALKPNVALNGGAEFMDLAGDGQPDLVRLDGPTPGFYEHDEAEGWEPFRPFTACLNRDYRDPNLKFVDLDGDGHADVLITEDNALVWHPSLAEEGFGPAYRVPQAWDEEKGPRLVFNDGEQSIYLADLSGDGLADLVRIRNGEVCYWPNLGYGRFGAKITMDNSPWFDSPDLFDQKRIRLADIDGSGTTDIIYLHREGARLYFNQSGNSWSQPKILNVFPRIDDLASIVPTDLLGNGTACLVWSSALPRDARRPMRYVNLMGGQKPHLLIKTMNNLGAETVVNYAPSTKFYLQDRRDGNPWITKLPFPVHVVERVTVTDKWRQTRFSSTYSYHHGYFDGVEREFRGFGRVEQIDVETFGVFQKGNEASPYITPDRTLYQPPVKTVTWFHTGLSIDRQQILSHYSDEYFPRWFEDLGPNETNVLGTFQENILPEPDLEGTDLSGEEWREALRACKGMPLRQEMYELDVDELEQGKQVPVKLFSTAYHNCHIHRLQTRAENRHAVFHVTESEAISYHYELDLRPQTVTPDPRIAHTLNLKIDELGNVLQAVAVVYPRIGSHQDNALSVEDRAAIDRVQQELRLIYTESRFTKDVDDSNNPDQYRLRLPCEVTTYELTGIDPKDQDDGKTADVRDDRYFTLDELRRYKLSERYQMTGDLVAAIPYQAVPKNTSPEKRLIEQARTLYFKANLTDPLPFGDLNHLGLVYEQYKLALTDDLLNAIFAAKLTPEVKGTVAGKNVSGYLSGPHLAGRFQGENTAGQYWICSGTAGFEPDAPDHFYLPERYIDPFGNVTRLAYDGKDLFITSSTDAKGNVTQVEQFDFRVLAPRRLKDINENLSEVLFDTLGMPTAVALLGKGSEADNLTGFDDALTNPTLDSIRTFFAQGYSESDARRFLGHATARHLYYFGEKQEADGTITWGSHPSCAAGILREWHVAQLKAGEVSPLQTAFEYSDGMGTVLVKKGQAEPKPGETTLQWIASGKTVLNNKGKPVKQYEPYFSPNEHRFEEPQEVGVTPILYYDAPGRLVRTEMPDGSYSRVEFSPWHVTSFDQNDTVSEPGNQWLTRRTAPTASAEEKRAAEHTMVHADTPSTTILDSLGREVVASAHNKFNDRNGVPQEAKYVTFTKLDAEGKPLWIRDARKNLVMQYITPPVANNQPVDPVSGFVPCYDIASNLLFQHSMDAGDRWVLNDAAGKPMYAWDVNERHDGTGVAITEQRIFFTRYDALHRPTEVSLTINGGTAQGIERFVYVDGPSGDHAKNLRGHLREHYDQSGLNQVESYDFKGKPQAVNRRLAADYKAPVLHWPAANTTAGLEAETFTQVTEYDALSRISRLYNWHHGNGSRVAVYEPKYSERGVLKSEELIIGATKTSTSYTEGAESRRDQVIKDITYDAKGQRLRISYGNNTVTRYDYDPETFRLRQLRTTRLAINPAFPNGIGLKDPHILQNLYYTYDPVGNITEIYDDAFEPAFFKSQVVEAKSQYTYDALYRLLSGTGRENGQGLGMPGPTEPPPLVAQFPITDPNALRNYTEHYAYDQVGNIKEMAHVANGGSWTRHYGYATDSNRLLKTWEGNNTLAAVTYQYDSHGSMLNYNNVAPGQFVQWDYRDMLHAIDLVGGGNVHYNYDASKRRTRKVIETQAGTKQWERLDLGGYEVFRRYSGGTLVEEIESLHLMDGDRRVLLVDDVRQTNNPHLNIGPLYRYQYGNHLSSVAVELDHQAEIISYEDYHPYGPSAYAASSKTIKATSKRYRYTAKERDDETGLSYHGARYYAPWLTRWGNPDPIGWNPDRQNLYAYCRGNPIVRSDPDGQQDSPQPWLAGRYPVRQPPPPGNPPGISPTPGSPHLVTPGPGITTDPLEAAARLHGATTSRLENLSQEIKELYSNYKQEGLIRPWQMDYLASYSGEPGPILERGAEAQSFVDAGLAEVGSDDHWHSTVLEHAIEGGLISNQADQNRFLAIAESERKTGRLKWAAWRGIQMALALLPVGRGAGGAVFARAPQSTTEVLSALNKATAAAKIEGTYINVIESMSARAIQFQELVSGGIKAGTSFLRNSVKFDYVDIARKVLVDAKGPGYANFVDKSGEFYAWFAGRATLIDQARRQIAAAKGMAIEWHFAEDSALKATQKLLNDAHITGIKLVKR